MTRTESEVDTIGQRLALAIQNWGGSRSELSRRLKARGIRGASMPSIATYLDDKVRPTLDFIVAAAQELRVRPDWLESGEGPAKVEDAMISDYLAEATAEGMHIADCLEGVLEALPWLAVRGDIVTKLALANAAALQNESAWGDRRRFGGKYVEMDESSDLMEESREFGRMMARAVMAPLDTLDLRPELFTDRELQWYLTAVAQALAQLGVPLGYKKEPPPEGHWPGPTNPWPDQTWEETVQRSVRPRVGPTIKEGERRDPAAG